MFISGIENIALKLAFRVCGASFNIEHALSCSKGGFIINRHNEIRNTTAEFLSEICFFFFFLYMAGLLQTGTISRYNTAESHSLMHYSQLCGTHQPRLCALELLPKEFTGGISDDPCRALHSNAARPRHTLRSINNTATQFPHMAG